MAISSVALQIFSGHGRVTPDASPLYPLGTLETFPQPLSVSPFYNFEEAPCRFFFETTEFGDLPPEISLSARFF